MDSFFNSQKETGITGLDGSYCSWCISLINIHRQAVCFLSVSSANRYSKHPIDPVDPVQLPKNLK
jgi:hypothetical protein